MMIIIFLVIVHVYVIASVHAVKILTTCVCCGRCVVIINVTIAGPAEVEISNGPMFMIDTTERLLISGTVNGQPDPNVTLYKVENGREVVISSDQMRIAVALDAVKLIITIDDVRVSDGGMYRVKAANEVGGSYAEFTIITQGESTVCLYTYMYLMLLLV